MITVHNGEQAIVSLFVGQNYVSQLDAVAGNRVGLFTPTVAQIGSGVNLLLTPTISEDKKYVGLNVVVAQNNLLGFDTFTFNQAAGAAPPGTETTTGGDDVFVDNNTGSTASTGTLQLPIFENNTIQTHVYVPDGGTLLLGGQKVTGEVEKEVGVPVLSKIPFIKRLFTNKALTKDSSTLLILIKPTIILQNEEEELRFGNLSRPLN